MHGPVLVFNMGMQDFKRLFGHTLGSHCRNPGFDQSARFKNFVRFLRCRTGYECAAVFLDGDKLGMGQRLKCRADDRAADAEDIADLIL